MEVLSVAGLLLFLKSIGLILTAFATLHQQIGMPAEWGTPTQAAYPEQWYARSVWDLALEDGILYAGCGDYAENSGPATIWSCDLSTGVWSEATATQDESVARFVTANGKLFAPGIDSTVPTWAWGNCYYLQQGKWQMFTRVPGAVHNFDIAGYDGKLYFAIGTSTGSDTPVLASDANMEQFSQVPFYRDAEPVFPVAGESYSRVYDFFELKGTLYCLFRLYTEEGKNGYQIYRLAEDGFHYVSDAEGLKVTGVRQIPVGGKVQLGDACYIATGNLYRTEDFQSFTPIAMPRGGYVTDLLTQDGVLYILCSTQQADGTYTVRIYARYSNYLMLPIAKCSATCPALSFVKDGKDFYIGFGGGKEETADVGKIIKVSLRFNNRRLQSVKKLVF
jgi:hypothetical protein